MADGSPYQILTKEVFQAILDQTPLKGVQVQQDVVLAGKDTPTHQIDVFWAFEVAGVTYQNLTQAKNWKRRVPQGELLMFRSVLEDIPGQPRGIFVSRRGYQRGARAFAKKNGILLYQLEPVTHDGPLNLDATTLGYARLEMRKTPLYVLGAGRVGYSYIAVGIVFGPELEDSMFNADLPWVSERYGLSADEAARRVRAIRVFLPPHEIKLFDEDGKEIGTVHRVYRGFVDQLMKKEGEPHKMTHRFETPTFIRASDPEIPLLKIDSISSTVTVKRQQYVERACGLPNMALCVLRNLNDGTVWLVGKKVPPATSAEVAAAPGSAA